MRAPDSDRVPWQATARAFAQRAGVDPRNLRRFRWFHKANAVRRCRASVWRHLQFVLLDPETDNYTYEIANEPELASWVADVARCEQSLAMGYVAEPRFDLVLAERRREATAGRWLWTRSSLPFGKRLGWYALARALRPRLIVEIGIHDGLGDLLLLRALERNADEGQPGRLVAFDVNPTAGWLVGTHPLWEPRYMSSRDGLRPLLEQDGPLGMFIYDGWHSYEHERADMDVAAEHLERNGVLVSDDAQVTHALADLCTERGLSYAEFREAPRGHFYLGSSLGAGRRTP